MTRDNSLDSTTAIILDARYLIKTAREEGVDPDTELYDAIEDLRKSLLWYDREHPGLKEVHEIAQGDRPARGSIE